MKQFTGEAEASALLDEVILGNPPEDAAAQAPAYNTLGDCLRAANRPTDAQPSCSPTCTPTCSTANPRKSIPVLVHQIAELYHLLKQDHGHADEVAQPA